MTDPYREAVGNVFHSIALLASIAETTDEDRHDAQCMAMSALIDFAYFEPGYFSALVRHQTQKYDNDKDTDMVRSVWRLLVEQYPLPLTEQAVAGE